jgi:hypothetical protein
MDMHKMLAEFKKRAADLARAAGIEDVEPPPVADSKVATFPSPEPAKSQSAADQEASASSEALCESAECPRHPAAVDAWREVLAAFEVCIQSAMSEGERDSEVVRQGVQETGRLLSEIDQLCMPVAIKQRFLAITMLLYPRLGNTDRSRMVMALQRIPHPTRSQLDGETELSCYDHDRIQGLVLAVQRSPNFGEQLYALLRSISRRLGVFPLPMRPALQPA